VTVSVFTVGSSTQCVVHGAGWTTPYTYSHS